MFILALWFVAYMWDSYMVLITKGLTSASCSVLHTCHYKLWSTYFDFIPFWSFNWFSSGVSRTLQIWDLTWLSIIRSRFNSTFYDPDNSHLRSFMRCTWMHREVPLSALNLNKWTAGDFWHKLSRFTHQTESMLGGNWFWLRHTLITAFTPAVGLETAYQRKWGTLCIFCSAADSKFSSVTCTNSVVRTHGGLLWHGTP